MDKINLSFLISRLNRRDAASPQQSLWSFAGLAQVHARLPHTGEASTGHSTPDVSFQCSPEMKATPSDLLAMLCLMQSRRPLVFTARELSWPRHNLLPIKTSLFCKAVFQPVSPQPVQMHGAIFLWLQNSVFSFVKLHRINTFIHYSHQ